MPDLAPTEGIHIPLQRKRVARAAMLAQVGQHLPAVMTVLYAGASAVVSEREGGGLALAAAELCVGAWVLVTIAGELRHVFGRHAGHGVHAAVSRIDVPGLAAAALGYVEVWHRTHEHGHFKLVSPEMLGATTTLVMALGGKVLLRRRFGRRRPHMLITPSGVQYRGSRRERWTAPWDDVAAVEHAPGVLALQLRTGERRVVRADDHLGGDALLAAARTAVVAHAPAHLSDGAPVRLSRS